MQKSEYIVLNDLFFNNKSIKEFSHNLVLIHSYITPLVLKRSKVEAQGRSGFIDNTFSEFNYNRYEEREIHIAFILLEDSKDKALEVITSIDRVLMQQKVEIKTKKDSFYHFEALPEQGVEYEQIKGGLYECSIVIPCYPLVKRNYPGQLQKWKDIDFSTDVLCDHYDELIKPITVYGTEKRVSKIFKLYLPATRPRKIVISVKLKDSISSGSTLKNINIKFKNTIIDVLKPGQATFYNVNSTIFDEINLFTIEAVYSYASATSDTFIITAEYDLEEIQHV